MANAKSNQSPSEDAGSGGETTSRQWWFKNVVVPVIGLLLGGGGLAALLSSCKEEPKPPVKLDRPVAPGGPNITTGDIKGNAHIAGRDIINLPEQARAKPFTRDIILHENDTRSVQGIVIRSRSIAQYGEGGEVYVELTIQDRGETKLPLRRAVAGDSFPIRTHVEDSINVAILAVEQYPTDRSMSWDDVIKLGLLGRGLVTKKATLRVSGEAKDLDSAEEIERDKRIAEDEIAQQYYMIKVPILGSIDARKIFEENWWIYFIGAIVKNDMHAFFVFIKMGVDVNCRDESMGITALTHAYYANNLTMFTYLLKKGADPDVANRDGKSVRELLGNRPDQRAFADAIRDYAKKQ